MSQILKSEGGRREKGREERERGREKERGGRRREREREGGERERRREKGREERERERRREREREGGRERKFEREGGRVRERRERTLCFLLLLLLLLSLCVFILCARSSERTRAQCGAMELSSIGDQVFAVESITKKRVKKVRRRRTPHKLLQLILTSVMLDVVPVEQRVLTVPASVLARLQN